MEKENILLSFKGMVTGDLLTSVLQIMESKMTYLQETPRMKKKVFNVLVECLQNLYHHIEEEKQNRNLEAKSALFVIVKEDQNFFIRTGNFIDLKSANELKGRLDIINAMNKEELKLHYQEALSSGTLSDKGTAGLGMIDIARKSGNKLEYEFLPINDDFQFFCLNVKID